MIKIFFSDEQTDEFALTELFGIAEKILEQDAPIEIDMSFLSLDEIRQLNLETRNIDKATDVLSYPNLDDIFGKKLKVSDYPYDICPESGSLLLGSIAICKEKAKEQSEEYGHSYEREIAYLAIHGLLHLFGYDHMEQEDKAIMREMEEKILNAAQKERK